MYDVRRIEIRNKETRKGYDREMTLPLSISGTLFIGLVHPTAIAKSRSTLSGTPDSGRDTEMNALQRRGAARHEHREPIRPRQPNAVRISAYECRYAASI